ncbi:MAG: hypothetical protein ABFD46_04200 [Armatimonadota bacterium]
MSSKAKKVKKVQRTIINKDQRWFEQIDPSLAADVRARLIEESAKRYFDATKDSSDGTLPDEDAKLLLEYSKDDDPRVRKTAVSTLLDGADVDWESIERWALDPEKDVREEALSHLMFSVHNEETIEWYIWLLSEIIERYADGQAGIAMSLLATQSEEWLNLTWQAAGELLDLDNKDVTMLLTCGYIEDVIRESRGPEDPRVAAWIKSGDKPKKNALLEVVDWLTDYDGHLGKIAAALVNDPDEEIAEKAKKLAGDNCRGEER